MPLEVSFASTDLPVAIAIPFPKETNKQQLTMKTNKIFPLAFAAFTISLPTSHAATIVAYDFATNASPTTGSVIANTTSTPVTSAGWFNNDQNGSSGHSGSSFSYFGRGPSTTAGTSYIGFTITADPNYTLTLAALSFNYHMSQIQSAGGPHAFTFELRSSLSNFATPISGTYSTNPVTAGSATPAGESASFDLSGGNYDDLQNITFRLYVTGSVTGNNDIARWDNILVEGAVNAIPEPSAALFSGFGLLALLRRRR